MTIKELIKTTVHYASPDSPLGTGGGGLIFAGLLFCAGLVFGPILLKIIRIWWGLWL